MRFALLLAALILSAPAAAQERPGPEVFAPEIAAFAAADQAQPPKACQVLFVGSSSIRFWRTLADDMAPVAVLNRGFGGSRISDVNHHFDKVVAPYRPRAIVFYAGENDLNDGRSADKVVDDFRRFLELKDRKVGRTPVAFISLKPSKLRIGQLAAQTQVNAAIRALADRRADLTFIDVVPAMLADGQPKEIFVADGLHLNPEGYVLWREAVRPHVLKLAEEPCAA